MSQNTKQPARGTQPDYYGILGVDGNASPEEIVEAYRALVLQCHPDLNPGDPQAEARFLAVQAAFEVLSSRVKRTEYDRTRGPNRTYVPSKNDPLAWHVRYNPPPQRSWTRDPCVVDLLRAPAMCLLVFGILSIPIDLYCSVNLYQDTIRQLRSAGPERSDQLQTQLDFIGFRSIASVALAIVVIVGALNMLTLRIYLLAVLGSIAAAIPCVGPCGGLGIFFGVFALIVLWDGHMVKDAFWY